jgi:predicted ATPase
MLSANSRDADFVINQFSIRTFLIIGISLTDNSLKNLLRSSAHRNPANHHFIVFHEDAAKPRTPEERADIFDVNLNVYNLISLFLTTDELHAFIEAMNSEDGGILDGILQEIVPAKVDRKYYLIGGVAVGKSTTLEALRCFATQEEWSGRVPAVMYLDDATLTPEQQKEVDDFLFPQLINKNKAMIRSSSGIRIMDRAYLDLFAFSSGNSEIKRKAEELAKRVLWNRQPLEEGQIIFLKASRTAFEERLARRGQSHTKKGKVFYNADKLIKQEEELMKAYRPMADECVDTSECSVGEAAREIARRILLGPYTTFDFTQRVTEIITKDGEL